MQGSTRPLAALLRQGANVLLPRTLLALIVVVVAPFAAAADSAAIATRARAVLHSALNEEKGFVKVHAAEALIDLGNVDAPRRVFAAELPTAAAMRPYRIGVWRVLAASTGSAAERAKWIGETEAVALDATAMDRLHAIESLGKLRHVPSERVRVALAELAHGPAALAVFPQWVLYLAGDPNALPAITAALQADDPVARLRAAYVLQWLKVRDAATRRALDRAAETEPSDSVGYTIITAAAVALDANSARTAERIAILETALLHGPAGARYTASQTLMHRYGRADLPKLIPLLDHADGDARIGAAWAILHILAANQ